MLRTFYRAMVIGRAKSAAEQAVNFLSATQLKDIGHTRWSFIEQSVASVRKGLDEAERKRNNRTIRYPEKPGLWVLYKYFNLRKAE